MKQFIKYITLIVCTCLCWACTDVEVVQGIDYSKPATVKLSIDFSDMQVVTPGSRSAGDAIGKMTDVCVLFYNTEGILAKDDSGAAIYHYKEAISSEATTMEKRVPAGEYKVVAVANMGDLVANSLDKVQDLKDLKQLSLTWDNDDVTKNNKMFGFFTTTANNKIDDDAAEKGLNKIAPTGYDAPDLQLTGEKTLYAKLYRTVAKVTVAFNGEGLNENVFVTIKSIRLGNLPLTCGLWTENNTEMIKDTVKVNDDGGAQGEKLTDVDFGLLRVANRGKGESLFPKEAHAPKGPSLFMFENRQGTAETDSAKHKTIKKKPYGAFIEIEALYANEATGSNGKIIYRYMLGEDTEGHYDNYNLTRNRHYKVTLMLQKSGKEPPQWRVEYDENKSITLPTEVNISYRHEAELNIPFTVTGNVSKVEAQIVENPWYDDGLNGVHEADAWTSLQLPKYGFLAWKGDLSTNTSPYYGTNKTNNIQLQSLGDISDGKKYHLEIQTEALGFYSNIAIADPISSFTGYNNYANPRTAKIKVTVTYADGTSEKAEVKVVQVPRIVNPIAIYRDWDSEKEFKIRLLNAAGQEIESYGPWSAEVESGEEWIGIKKETDNSYSTSKITSDKSGGAIRFDYKPQGTLLTKDATPRCGVIVVRFSNYNVEHRIYVRQGYAPMAIGNRPTLWTSYNYIGIDKEKNHLYASSPMEEGAWLKKSNPIGFLANDNQDNFDSGGSWVYKMSNGGSTQAWGNIKPGDGCQFKDGDYQLPKDEDINNLLALAEHSGFGVGYDDNATATSSFDENTQYTDLTMGKRGIVVCDEKGRNLFFPIGKRGHGRRRNGIDPISGSLHYANTTKKYEDEKEFWEGRPAMVGLYKAMGAIYWTNGHLQLSFNYSLANFDAQNETNFREDACFARLVKLFD